MLSLYLFRAFIYVFLIFIGISQSYGHRERCKISYDKAWEEEKFNSPRLKEVEHLFPLEGYCLSKEQKKQLVLSSSLTNLTNLDLRGQDIDDIFIEELCKNYSFSKVKTINISGNPKITSKSLELILTSPIIGTLYDTPEIVEFCGEPYSTISVILDNDTQISPEDIDSFKIRIQFNCPIRYLSSSNDGFAPPGINEKGIKNLFFSIRPIRKLFHYKPFYFMRHGETDLNKQGIIMGSIDLSLNEEGQRQALTASSILKTEKFDSIISSPRKRALQTASVIAQSFSKSIITNDGLLERCWGTAEGKPLSSLQSLFDSDPEDGEPFLKFQQRVISTINLFLCKEGTPLFVSHAGVLTALVRYFGFGYQNLFSSNCSLFLFTPPPSKGENYPWYIHEIKKKLYQIELTQFGAS